MVVKLSVYRGVSKTGEETLLMLRTLFSLDVYMTQGQHMVHI
jgi:hypothetical protein